MFNINDRDAAFYPRTEHAASRRHVAMTPQLQSTPAGYVTDRGNIGNHYVPAVSSPWTPAIHGHYYHLQVPIFAPLPMQQFATPNSETRSPACQPPYRYDSQSQRTPNILSRNGEWETRVVRHTLHLATPRIIPSRSPHSIIKDDSTSSFDAESSCLNVSDRGTTNHTITDESDTEFESYPLRGSSHTGHTHRGSLIPLSTRKQIELQQNAGCDACIFDKPTQMKTHRKAIPALNLQDLNTIEEEILSKRTFEGEPLTGKDRQTIEKTGEQSQQSQSPSHNNVIPKLKLTKLQVQDDDNIAIDEPLHAPRSNTEQRTRRDKTQSVMPISKASRMPIVGVSTGHDVDGCLTARPRRTENNSTKKGVHAGSLTQRGKPSQRVTLDYIHMNMLKNMRSRKTPTNSSLTNDVVPKSTAESSMLGGTANNIDRKDSIDGNAALSRSTLYQQSVAASCRSDETVNDANSDFVPNTFEDIADVPRHSHLSVRDIQLIGSKVGYLNHGGRDAILDDAAIINSGTFCVVVQGVYSGELVAVKMPEKHHLSTDPVMAIHRAIQEWRILSRCNHPNIIRFHGGVMQSDDIWLVMEMVSGSDLYTLLHHRPIMYLRPHTRVKMLKQLASSVSYLHSLRPKIVHKDIKSNNILVDTKLNIRLCDFGDSEITPSKYLSCYTAATWQYAPPEILAAEDPSKPVKATDKVDVWAMGCVFLEICLKQTPFKHILNNVHESQQRDLLRNLLQTGQLEKEKNLSDLPPVVLSLISKCLQINPEDRPTALFVVDFIDAHSDTIQEEIELVQARHEMEYSRQQTQSRFLQPALPTPHVMPTMRNQHINVPQRVGGIGVGAPFPQVNAPPPYTYRGNVGVVAPHIPQYVNHFHRLSKQQIPPRRVVL